MFSILKHNNTQLMAQLQARTFGRYLNRGQQAAIDMKSDLTSYEYKTEMISRLDPAPSYPQKAMMSDKQTKRHANSQYNLERIRSSGLNKKQKEAKFVMGRFHSHLKLEQMRVDVQKIKSKEQLSTNDKRGGPKGIDAPDVQIDDQFLLPYDTGYDHVIKKKAELIDS